MSAATPVPSPDEDAWQHDVTVMLNQLDGGDPTARSRMVERIYPELRRIAEIRMRQERFDHTLQPTELVNEFFLIMAQNQTFTWKNRAHFLALASRAMRRVLIDYSRARNAEKRGGGAPPIELECVELADTQRRFDTLEISELLDQLHLEEPRMARVVELRCFGGLTHREVGEVLGIDERTAKRDWQVARAWLFGKLNSGGNKPGSGMKPGSGGNHERRGMGAD